MTRPMAVIAIHLLIAFGISQFLWVRAEKRAAYLEGRQSVYNEFAADGTEGTCYAKGGCDELQSIRHKSHHTVKAQ